MLSSEFPSAAHTLISCIDTVTLEAAIRGTLTEAAVLKFQHKDQRRLSSRQKYISRQTHGVSRLKANGWNVLE